MPEYTLRLFDVAAQPCSVIAQNYDPKMQLDKVVQQMTGLMTITNLGKRKLHPPIPLRMNPDEPTPKPRKNEIEVTLDATCKDDDCSELVFGKPFVAKWGERDDLSALLGHKK